MNGRVRRLRRIGFTVSDLDRLAAFYTQALGFDAEPARVADPGYARLLGTASLRVQRLRLGAQEIELAAFASPGVPYPENSTAADLWFQHLAIVVADMGAAHARLEGYGATPISLDGPQRLPPEASHVTAYKFRDPDGHPLELIQFPPGTGPAAWRAPPPGALHLGLDHSAISVADVGRSVAFYETLGFTPGHRTLNEGPAQERLDGLRGDEVDVVPMLPPATTPHVELLGYRHPHGRASPGIRQNDLASTRLVLEMDAARAEPALIHDPDGHTVVCEAGTLG